MREPEHPPRVSQGSTTVLVLNWNGEGLLRQNLPSIVRAATAGKVHHRVVVIDNASIDGSEAFVQRHCPGVDFWRSTDNGYLFSFNDAVRRCNTDTVILLNNDVRVREDFIAPLLNRLQDPGVFAAVPKIESNKPTEAYLYRCPGVFEGGRLLTARWERSPGAGNTYLAHGAAAAYDRMKFLKIGGFDDIFFPCYGEDTDLSYRAWMTGWRIVFEPSSVVFHEGGASTSAAFEPDRLSAHRFAAEMLFNAKNLDSPRMLSEAAFWGLARVLIGSAKGHWWPLLGMLRFLGRLPGVVSRRKMLRTHRRLSTLEVLARVRNGGCG